MKILFHTPDHFTNSTNKLFEKQDDSIDNEILAPYRLLASLAQDKGVEIASFSKIHKEKADAFVFSDIPQRNDEIFHYATLHNVKRYLLAMESPLVNKESFLSRYHAYFEKVFTWSDDLVAANPQKYIKLNYCYYTTYKKELDLILFIRR